MLDWLQTPGGSRPVCLRWGGGKTAAAAATPDQLETEERHDCSCVDKLGPEN